MKPIRKIILFLTLLLWAGTAKADHSAFFDLWKEELKAEALKKGISAATFDDAMKGVTFNEKVIELDRKQAEFTYTVWEYLDRMVNEARVKHGRTMLKKHKKLLREIERKYGVPGEYIIAFWGMESNFGVNFGGFYAIEALASLAYDTRRPDMFRRELLAALQIIEENHIKPENMKGSWAGAMGNFQFLPSTYRAYAVDHDGDGVIDVWKSLPDSFASAANYLSKMGWKRGQRWGREVVLPKNLSWPKLRRNMKRSVAEWQTAGIRLPGNKKFVGGSDIQASIIFPSGYMGPVFLTYPNFNIITRWNNSVLYAIAVGHLTDRFMGEPKLATKRVTLYNPDKEETKNIQRMLLELGYMEGKIDGIKGKETREAVAKAQRNYKLPIDGYPSVQLVRYLRRDVRQVNATEKRDETPDAGRARTGQ